MITSCVTDRVNLLQHKKNQTEPITEKNRGVRSKHKNSTKKGSIAAFAQTA